MGQATQKQIEYAKRIANTLGIKLPDNKSFEVMNQFIRDYQGDYYKEKNKEVRERICSEIKIVDYAREIGYTPIRKGRFYSLAEHDSVRIDPEKNCYWQNSKGSNGYHSEGGSVIDFAVNLGNSELKEVMKDFSSRVSGMTVMVEKKKEILEKKKGKEKIKFPEKAEDMRRVYAYLIKSRYLDQEIVQHFVGRRMLYQDVRNNCVFVSYDGEEPVFGCVRGTNTYKRFVGDVPNCDYEKGFYINNHSDKLIITESVIDAMSVMTILRAKGLDYTEYDYLPLASAYKYESLIRRLQTDQKKEVYIALDNDKTGKESAEVIEKLIKGNGFNGFVEIKLPEEHDWNDELKAAFQTGMNYMNIKMDIGQNGAGEKIKVDYIQKACAEAKKVFGIEEATKEIEADYGE